MPASASATAAATTMRSRTVLTVVLGSVTMKKMNSWYIGPVSGAISASSGPPLIELRSAASTRKQVTYVSVTCSIRTREAISSPKHQITVFVARSLPHCWLSTATLAGAARTSRLMAKLLGFQRCRPRYCSTYLEAMATKPPSANGHSSPARGLIRSARLIPVMYALATFAKRPPPSQVPGARTAVMLWLRLGDDVQPVHGGVRERLHTARGPANARAVHLRALAEAEVDPAVVLARESRAPVHDLELARPARDEQHLRSDGAAVRARAHELERNPVVARRTAGLVHERRLALVRHHDVEHTAIEQIRQGDGPAVVLVGHPYGGGDVDPSRQAAVHQHARSLVAGEAGSADRRPAERVLEPVALGAGVFGHRVPVAGGAVGGDVPVDDDQLVASVVVEVAELRAPGPPRVGDDPLGGLLEPTQLRQELEAQVVAVKQVAPLRDVGHEGVHAPAIQHVAERGRHAALGIALQAHPAQGEALAVVVQVELFGSVVFPQEQTGPAVAVEARRGDREGPARASHAHPIGHVLEPPIPEVMKQPVLASVGSELEAVLHDARGLQVPEVDVGPEVPCHVQIEQSIPIVVDPHGRVAVHPLPQSRLRGDVFEVEVAQVLEELEVAPLVDQQVLEPVVVEVAPHRPHRHALARPIHVRDAGGGGDVDERAVAAIHVQRVGCIGLEGGPVMHEPDA